MAEQDPINTIIMEDLDNGDSANKHSDNEDSQNKDSDNTIAREIWQRQVPLVYASMEHRNKIGKLHPEITIQLVIIISKG